MGGSRAAPILASFQASPVRAGDLIDAVSRSDGTHVLPAEQRFEVLAHNLLESDDTMFDGTPASSRGQPFLRSGRSLYCISDRVPVCRPLRFGYPPEWDGAQAIAWSVRVLDALNQYCRLGATRSPETLYTTPIPHATMKKAFLASALAAGMLCSGCLGPSNAYNSLNNWSARATSMQWVNEVIYLGMWVIPVFPLALTGDVLLFNTVEFWGGENWIDDPGPYPGARAGAEAAEETIEEED